MPKKVRAHNILCPSLLICGAALAQAVAPDALATSPTVETNPVAIKASVTAPERLICDGLPYVDQGTSMVPARQVCDFLQAKLTFNDGLLSIVKTFSEPALTRTIAMRMGGKSAQIWDGGVSRFVNLPHACEARLGTVFVPAKFLVEMLGGEIVTDKQFVPQSINEGNRQGVFSSNYDAPYNGADAARVTIVNRVGRALSLRLTGPQKRRIEIGRNGKISLQLKPGMYYYQAGSAGLQTINSSRRLLAGRQTTWAWGKQ